ncbi:MAG: TMEM43 family protein [Geminicoccaceae bacterium]|nr:TMEM43 family protein [Geminicoccaceae bacterium]
MAGRKRVSAFILGIMFVAGGIGGLFYNEMRSADRISTLLEAEDSVTAIPPGTVNPATDGGLVHLIDEPEITGIAIDPLLAVEAAALRLDRVVEMYQWREENQGSGDSKQSTYVRVWSKERIRSETFDDRGGHDNPPAPPIASQSFFPSSVELGRYLISAPVLAMIDADIAKTPREPRSIEGIAFSPTGSYLQSGTPAAPAIGDIRISLLAAQPETVTAMGRNDNGTIGIWRSGNGDELTILRSGAFSADELIDEQYTANSRLTWALRAALTLSIFVGMMIIIKRIARMVPVIGRLAARLLKPVAFVLAVAIALVTMAFGWLVFRPVLSLMLLAGAGILVLVLRWMRAKTPDEDLAHADVPPPPPPPGASPAG